MTTKERQERSKERFRCTAVPTIDQRRRELERSARKMRERERMARKMYRESRAEEYRRAGNALENAIAELEKFTTTDEGDKSE